MRLYTLNILFLSLLFVACGGNEGTDEVAGEDPAAMSSTESEAPDVSRTDGVTIVDMPATQRFPDAKINGVTYQKGKFDFDVSGYEFAIPTADADQVMCANSDKGQHIHLILDNEPYLAKYEPNFEQEVADGDHYMLSFLSRSYHQSIKESTAAKAGKISVKNGSFDKISEIQSPMLFYSRPKGTYRGKKATENVMVDFYPINAPMSDGYMVRAELDGQPLADFTEWKSYYLNGLEMGDHTLKLTLMDKNGAVVNAPLNPVSRTFTLEALPTGE